VIYIWIDVQSEHNYVILSNFIQRINYMFQPLLCHHQVVLILGSNCIWYLSFDRHNRDDSFQRKISLLCWLFPSSPHVRNSHFTGRDMIGESKRPRQSDRWTPRQDPREPTINLSEDGTFRLCPQAKNLGPSVLSSLSAGTKKLATCCTKHV